MISIKIGDEPKTIVPLKTNPSQFIGNLFQKGIRWKIDYSKATPVEIVSWFKFDFSARCSRAIFMGLPVRFLDKTYQVIENNRELALKTIQQIEDDLVASKIIMSIDRDDEEGFVVGVRGYEK